MFKFLLPALAAAALAATPAAAQQRTNSNFTGPRIEVNAGVEDVTNSRRNFNDVTYGAAIGADGALGDRFTLGGEVSVSNPLDDTGRQFGAAARLGYALDRNVLAFGRVGYTNVDIDGLQNIEEANLEGLTLGGGVNFALTPNLYTSVEYRYTDFEHNIGSHGARVGVGLRF